MSPILLVSRCAAPQFAFPIWNSIAFYFKDKSSDPWCRSDALEAYLLDGECVKKWCHSALEREHSHILQGLTRGLASLATKGDLYRHVGRLTSLVSILEALGQPAEHTTAAPAQSSRELVLAQQLHQCALVSHFQTPNETGERMLIAMH